VLTGRPVVIIGGGVVGLSIAFHLVEAGYPEVTVLERGLVGEGTTARATGGIRQQFTSEVNVRMVRDSVEFFTRFAERTGYPLDFRRHGYLFLLSTEPQLEVFRAAADMQRRNGVPTELLSPDEVLAITARRAGEVAPLSLLGVHYYGGGIQRVDEQATAMSHRDKPWNYTVTTTWPSMQDGAPVRGWQDEWVAELEPHTHDAFYVNYLFDQPEDVQRAYNPLAWARLRALKRSWDPGNLFATNQNIPPAGSDEP